MKKKFAIAGLILVLTPMAVLAQSSSTNPPPNTTPCTLGAVQYSNDKASELPRCVNQIYTWSLGIGALLALLMMIIGGYYYMTASGNAEQASKGTEYIWGAVIGLVILFGAYLLLNTINPDLVNFKAFSNDFQSTNSTQNQTNNPTAPRTP
jgi:hypothetical protein